MTFIVERSRQHASRADAAIALLAGGIKPVPVPAGRKAPTYANWPERLISENEVDTLFAGQGNIGVLLGEPSGFLVDVDLDCEEARELAGDYLPETGAVTGRATAPGSHLWYRAQHVKNRRFSDPITGECILELRSTGLQTLVGPSIHPGTGERYDDLDPSAIAEASAAELLDGCEKLHEAVLEIRGHQAEPQPQQAPRGAGPSAEVPDDRVIARAVAYLDRMPEAVSGQGGHNKTYAAATSLVHGFALDPDLALRLLLERYNPRCDPPWSEKELRHKVESARDKPHDQPFGWLRDAQPERDDLPQVDVTSLMASLSGSEAAEAAGEVEDQIRTAGELLKGFPTLRRPLFDGLLRLGETMNIVGAPKTNKSWLSLDIALSVATGKSLFGRYAVDPGRALIIDNELHPETLAFRLGMVSRARAVPADDFADRILVDCLRGRLKPLDEMGGYFEGIVGRYPDLKLIVLDAMYRFMPRGESENDNATMAGIYNALDRVADKLGVALVCIHHTSKGNQAGKSITDIGAGAGAQSRAADAHVALLPHQDDGVSVMRAVVRTFPPPGDVGLRWTFPVFDHDPDVDTTLLDGVRKTGGMTCAEQSAADRELAEEEYTVRGFAHAIFDDDPITRDEVNERGVGMGLSKRFIRQRLGEAVDAGLVKKSRARRADPYLYTLNLGQHPQMEDE